MQIKAINKYYLIQKEGFYEKNIIITHNKYYRRDFMKKLVLNITEEDFARFDNICKKHLVSTDEILAAFIKDTANCPGSNEAKFVIMAEYYFIALKRKFNKAAHISKYAEKFQTSKIENTKKNLYNISISDEEYNKFIKLCDSEKLGSEQIIENFIRDVGNCSNCNEIVIKNKAGQYFDMLWWSIHPETNEFVREMDGTLHKKEVQDLYGEV